MTRRNGIFKQSNEYARLVDNYDKIPKAVFAAIAVSALNIAFCEDDLSKINEVLINEWNALYNSGIIPQKPIKTI